MNLLGEAERRVLELRLCGNQDNLQTKSLALWERRKRGLKKMLIGFEHASKWLVCSCVWNVFSFKIIWIRTKDRFDTHGARGCCLPRKKKYSEQRTCIRDDCGALIEKKNSEMQTTTNSVKQMDVREVFRVQSVIFEFSSFKNISIAYKSYILTYTSKMWRTLENTF